MIIIPHNERLGRPWKYHPDGWYSMLSERLRWAGDNFECEVDLRGIAAPNSDGRLEWAYVRAVVGPKQDTELLSTLSYPGLRFEHERVPLPEFLMRLNQSRVGERLVNGNEPAASSEISIGELHAVVGRIQGWQGTSSPTGDGICYAPNWQAYTSLSQPLEGPFVSSSPNHPFYPRKLDAFADLSGLSHIDPRDGRLRSFNIVVLDQRGYIDGLNYSEEGLSVTLAGKRLDTLTLQLRHSRGAWTAKAAEFVNLPDLELPSQLDLALVSSEHELIDQRSWSVFPVPDETELYTLIGGGENEIVEFKPWVMFSGDKFNEIIDTVIAFGNGEAEGTLIIGVDDYGRPASWKLMTDFESAARAGVANVSNQLTRRSAAVDYYARKLVDKLGERMAPLPPIRWDVHEYDGSVVLQLKVSPAPLMVMQQINNYVLVRRGASNRPPSREALTKLAARGR